MFFMGKKPRYLQMFLIASEIEKFENYEIYKRSIKISRLFT